MNGRVRDIYALFAAIVLLIAAFVGPEAVASQAGLNTTDFIKLEKSLHGG